MTISKNSVVTLEYTITDTTKNLLDSGADPLIYLHGGYNDVFAKIEQALDGKTVGDSIKVQLTPKESFGEYDDSLVTIEERGEFDDNIYVGEQFIEVIEDEDEAVEDQKISYTIKEITKDNVTLDGNHPLAGIDVIFTATVLAVRKATAKEIKDEHARS
ncbi:FKBP-type peptidyl-prolyl cis-trans isomerase [Sulfurospirillum arsenophilum]|uniref:FKBP-type peptidyl-prolyl cis-trans isomerase n=1 Tax=Sulfurospirillum arsenophilum TaxID=56698 RepID=UPI0005A7CAC8|nr:peptidylprolyl isomerase [Sulfurospirillum arsenophilum]